MSITDFVIITGILFNAAGIALLKSLRHFMLDDLDAHILREQIGKLYPGRETLNNVGKRIYVVAGFLLIVGAMGVVYGVIDLTIKGD
ncbi:MAG: hypothetical protein MJA84_06115 [Firmicutes bacterium]|nr:hypothetical protein [Bacillota bacterium]